jgi:hypothetical protein
VGPFCCGIVCSVDRFSTASKSPKSTICSFDGLSTTKSCRFDRRYALYKSSYGPLTMLSIAWAFTETKQAQRYLDSCHSPQGVLQGQLLASTDARFQIDLRVVKNEDHRTNRRKKATSFTQPRRGTGRRRPGSNPGNEIKKFLVLDDAPLTSFSFSFLLVLAYSCRESRVAASLMFSGTRFRSVVYYLFRTKT